MMQLIKMDLTSEQYSGLHTLQNRVDAETDFTKRIQKAESLWANKGGNKGKKVFKDIKTTRIKTLLIQKWTFLTLK